MCTPVLNAAKADSRWDCVRSPWISSHRRPIRASSRLSHVAVAFFCTKTIVRSPGTTVPFASNTPSFVRLSPGAGTCIHVVWEEEDACHMRGGGCVSLVAWCWYLYTYVYIWTSRRDWIIDAMGEPTRTLLYYIILYYIIWYISIHMYTYLYIHTHVYV